MNTAPLMAPMIGVRISPVWRIQLWVLELLEVGRAEPLSLFEVDAGAKCRVGTGEYHRPHRRVVVSLA